MSFKLSLTAGHYMGTPGKRCMKSIDPAETREWWLNDRIADKIEKILSDYEDIEILRTDDTTGTKEVELEDRVTKANNFGADFYLSVHHNAGANGTSAGGITVYVCKNCSTASKDWQKSLYDALVKATGLKGNRVSPLYAENLYEVTYTTMPAVLLELGFMDSTIDVPIILTQEFADQCAQACVDVIVEKAGLKKKVNTTASGNAYKVVAPINRYSTVEDAKVKTNSKGKYEAGTYYIYNKYPNGLDGMYNISTDKTGASAGSWINPVENVVETPKEDTTVPVYDLNYPEKHKIVEFDNNVDNTELERNCTKAINGILANNSDFDVEIAKTFFKFAPTYGIDPMMAIAQSILETGWFKYNGSAVTPDQHNYCGLGVTSNGMKGCMFDTIENGVRAQLQHLYAYGCKDFLPSGEDIIIDPRFTYVTRGIAPYWQNLAGRWAVPGYDSKTYSTPESAMNAGNTYGQKIRSIYNKLIGVVVSDDDIQKYFAHEEDDVISTPEQSEEQTVSGNTGNMMDSIFELVKKIIEAIVDIVKHIKK